MKKLLNITFARFLTLCTLLVAPFYSFADDDIPYYCPDRKYTSCNTGYYMAIGGVYNGTPQLGNACDECPAGCTCAGGTAAPACSHSVSYKCDANGDIYQTDQVIYMAEYHTLAEVCNKPGYNHTMWYDSENSTNKLLPDDDLEWPYETDKTFIAEYIPNTFNVSYAGNGNTGGVAPSAPSAPTACTYDATCVAPANTYTRDGYTFTGWKCTGGDASCDGDIIQPGTSISNATTVFNGAIKLTAQWNQVSTECAPGECFTITTINMSADSTFSFDISASGTFYVDCGDGGTLSGTGVSGNTITRNNTTNARYTCTYPTAGTHKIRFAGDATGYATSSYTAAISFNGNTDIKTLEGSLGAIFSGSAAGMFYSTFYDCTSLESIPETLFAGVTGSAESMFSYTFYGCTSLTSIPETLFAGVSGSANYMFSSTFENCTSLESILENLFAGVSGSAAGMFTSTFQGCTSLTSIHETLFAGVSGSAAGMFNSTFYDCTSLTSIPETLFAGVSGSAEYMFSYTFYGCTSLTSIPENLFAGVTGSANYMFSSTFENCTSLESILENLFAGVTGSAAGMFSYTFYGCTSLTSLPDGLFKNIVGTPAKNMFYATFSGCTNLKGWKPNGTDYNPGWVPANMFAGLDSTGYSSGPMTDVFKDTAIAESCPANWYQYITGFESDWDDHVSCAQCPDTHPNSVAGATNVNECYTSCEVSCFVDDTICPDNATCTYITDAKETGKENFGGTCSVKADKCAIQEINCNNGYTLNGNQCVAITYTVYYNDGANIAEAQCTYGTPCVVKDATRTGYDLTGWACISDIMNCDEDTLIQPQTDLNTYVKEGATSGQSVDMVAVWQAKKYTCDPGKYLNGTQCLDCTPGAYCPGVKDVPYDGGTHGFEDCPDDGSSPDNAEKRTQCYIIEKCTDGGDGTRTCHYETKGYTNCTACEYNTCDKGYYKNGQTCDICPVGYSCDGTYKTICDTGTYADKQGQETCTPCPQPYTQTDSQGATSATQCYATCDVSCTQPACDIKNVQSCEYESRKIDGIKYNDGQNICQVPSTANLTCAITGFTCQDGYAKNGNLCEPIVYKIKYVLDGGTNDGSNPTEYTVESENIGLQPATRTGYTFNGWYDSATGGNRITEIKQGEIGDKILYARWLARTIILQFETGGIGVAPTTPDNCTYDSVFDMPDAVKVNGYNFDKWSVNGKKFSANASVACTYDNLGTGDVAIISATWADPDAYTIKYYENGGTDVDDDKYTVADTVTLPTTITRAGYTFAGWYNNDNFTGSAVTQIKQGNTGDRTFWAQWNKCTAGKYCPGDNNEHNCPAGFPKSDPGATSDAQCYALCDVACTQPVCDIKNVQSCEYESRKIDGIKYNDGQNICQVPSTANLTCAITGFTCQGGYAKNGNLCEPIVYTIKYYENGGTDVDDDKYTVADTVTLPITTLTGYTFAGWYDSATGGNRTTEITQGTTGDKTFWAQWNKCTAGKYCPGDNNEHNCPAGFPKSDPGATSVNDCYQPCEIACTQPACPAGTKCDYEQKMSYGNQYYNATCDATPIDCDFSVSCKPAFEMIAGQCEPCMREHALSYKATGNCLVETCEDGYYPDGTECRNAVIDCTDIKPNATHATQTWLNTGFGKCVVHECDSGYHIENNNCVADEMPCDLDNGTGLKTWNPVTRAWNTCTVVECMPGYTSDPTLTNENWKQCGRCNNMYADNGALVASSYIHECEIASCFYQGERYILEDNECRLICDEYSDETGHRYWDDKRKKCVHDCNIGYNPW